MIFRPKSSCFLLFLWVFWPTSLWPHPKRYLNLKMTKWNLGICWGWWSMKQYAQILGSWFFTVPVGPMVNFLQDPLVIYEGWTSLGVNNCFKMQKEITISQKTRNPGEFVDIFLADTYPKKPLFFQGFQSLNKQMLWDDGSRIFFSYKFSGWWKTRAHTKHQDRLLQSCCGCWSWRFTLGHLAKGIWNSRTFSHWNMYHLWSRCP